MSDAGFGGVVGALLLRVEDAGAGDGGEVDQGCRLRRVGGVERGIGDDVGGKGARDDEGGGEICVEEGAEEGERVGFGGEVGAVCWVVRNGGEV